MKLYSLPEVFDNQLTSNLHIYRTMNTMNGIVPFKEHSTYCESYKNTKEKLGTKF